MKISCPLCQEEAHIVSMPKEYLDPNSPITPPSQVMCINKACLARFPVRPSAGSFPKIPEGVITDKAAEIVSGAFESVAEGIWPDAVIIIDQRHGIRREFNRADGCPNPLEASRKVMKAQLFFPRHAVLWGCSLTVFCNRGEHETGRDWKTGGKIHGSAVQ